MFSGNLGKYFAAAVCFVISLFLGNVTNLQASLISNLDPLFVMIGRAGLPLFIFLIVLLVSLFPPGNLIIQARDMINWFKTKAWGLQLINQVTVALGLIAFTAGLSECPDIKLSVLACSSSIAGLFSTVFAIIFLHDVSKIAITQFCFSLITCIVFIPNVIADGYGKFYIWYFFAAIMYGAGDTLNSYLNSEDLDRPSTLLYKWYPIDQKERVITSVIYGICVGMIAFVVPLIIVLARLMFASTRTSVIIGFSQTCSHWLIFTGLFLSSTLVMVFLIASFNLASSASIQPFKILDVFIATLLGIGWKHFSKHFSTWLGFAYDKRYDFEHFTDILPKYLFVCVGFILMSSVIIILIKSNIIDNALVLGTWVMISILGILLLGFVTKCITLNPFANKNEVAIVAESGLNEPLLT